MVKIVADLEVRHLKYLIAVARTGSITQAARRLMITQPALLTAARRHGPVVRSVPDVITAVVAGRAIAFGHCSPLPKDISGIRVRPVDDLSPSRLEIGTPAYGASATAKEYVEYIRNRWTLAGR